MKSLEERIIHTDARQADFLEAIEETKGLAIRKKARSAVDPYHENKDGYWVSEIVRKMDGISPLSDGFATTVMALNKEELKRVTYGVHCIDGRMSPELNELKGWEKAYFLRGIWYLGEDGKSFAKHDSMDLPSVVEDVIVQGRSALLRAHRAKYNLGLYPERAELPVPYAKQYPEVKGNELDENFLKASKNKLGNEKYHHFLFGLDDEQIQYLRRQYGWDVFYGYEKENFKTFLRAKMQFYIANEEKGDEDVLVSAKKWLRGMPKHSLNYVTKQFGKEIVDKFNPPEGQIELFDEIKQPSLGVYDVD